MTEHEASRTLVKSPPELWAECSDSAALTRHLGPFGEIRITKLEPENAVAWEGQRASGTVRLEPSGWGTRVTLTAREVRAASEAAAAAAAGEVAEIAVEDPQPGTEDPQSAMDDPEPDTTDAAAGPAPPRPGFLARLRAALRRRPPEPAPPSDVRVESDVQVEVAVVEPEAAAVREPAPEAPAADPPSNPHPEAVLTAALDSLGKAHHRPFSRA